MYAIVDCRISESSLSALGRRGFTPILMPPADYLSKPVASHADMLVFVGFGRLFCHKKYYKCNKTLIDGLLSVSNLALSLSDEETCEKYPHDVLFNACLVGKRLICNEKTVSKSILDTAKAENYEIVSVSQGYTKCSVCPVGENAIITADSGIAEACRLRKIEVLKISEGNVSLPPYEYGFIGGASGSCGKKIFFNGSLDLHPDGEKIKNFCTQNGAEVISLSNEKLHDVGTIYFI